MLVLSSAKGVTARAGVCHVDHRVKEIRFTTQQVLYFLIGLKFYF